MLLDVHLTLEILKLESLPLRFATHLVGDRNVHTARVALLPGATAQVLEGAMGVTPLTRAKLFLGERVSSYRRWPAYYAVSLEYEFERWLSGCEIIRLLWPFGNFF